MLRHPAECHANPGESLHRSVQGRKGRVVELVRAREVHDELRKRPERFEHFRHALGVAHREDSSELQQDCPALYLDLHVLTPAAHAIHQVGANVTPSQRERMERFREGERVPSFAAPAEGIWREPDRRGLRLTSEHLRDFVRRESHPVEAAHVSQRAGSGRRRALPGDAPA